MAVADLYTTYGDALLPYTNLGGQLQPATSLLATMLLKCSSNDKKFVIEEAQRSMQVCGGSQRERMGKYTCAPGVLVVDVKKPIKLPMHLLFWSIALPTRTGCLAWDWY